MGKSTGSNIWLKKYIYLIVLTAYILFTIISSIGIIIFFRSFSLPFGSFFVPYSLLLAAFGNIEWFYFSLALPFFYIIILIACSVKNLVKPSLAFMLIPTLLLMGDLIFQIVKIVCVPILSFNILLHAFLNTGAIIAMLFCIYYFKKEDKNKRVVFK